VALRQEDSTVDGDAAQSAASATIPGGRVTVIAAVAAVGGFLFGFDTAVKNGAVGAIESHFSASAFEIGFTVSSALLGSAVGAWFAGGLADRSGRVPMMRIAALLSSRARSAREPLRPLCC
jgi:SP family sugar:H+ symporter-like MFS transporter